MIGGYRLLDVGRMEGEQAEMQAMRLNALGSLYWFAKVVLRKRRMNPREVAGHIHQEMCEVMERHPLKELIEVPRDHFKTTIAGEALPIWRALPFTSGDEELLRLLGYGDETVLAFRRRHNPDVRILIVSEVEKNAQRIGQRISIHYQSNDLFRALFADILPPSGAVWNAGTMTHRRSPGMAHGEGTYNFLGTGSALQSNHFDLIIQDDLVGRMGPDSAVGFEEGIQYHQLLVGAFDNQTTGAGEINEEVVIGNRWAENDLNEWIRRNEPVFRLTSHSALGGCCDRHPPASPIFPEEFSLEKLESFRARQGDYVFSCQFENNPMNPRNRAFEESWLRFYSFEKVFGSMRARFGDGEGDSAPLDEMERYMVVDPKHSQEATRARHAIVVTGVWNDMGREVKFVLDCWAGEGDFTEFLNKIYELGEKWKLHRFWIETTGAQTYIKYHIEQENARSGRWLDCLALKTSNARNAKHQRILALAPFFRNGELMIRRDARDLIWEYERYPPRARSPIDLLDALAYSPQVWEFVGAMPEIGDDDAGPAEKFGAAGY